jgi:hypothetical protein
MIRYSLQCDKEHDFEGWFASSAAFDTQAARGLLECPSCGSKHIEKALMAPRVAGTKAQSGRKPAQEHSAEPSKEIAVANTVPTEVAEFQKARRELAQLMRQLRQEIATKSDYVGNKFAEEARKIHYDEVEPRGIWGEATRAEAEALLEEGIGVLPLPPLPEDRN